MFFHYLDLSWRSFKRTPLVSALMVIAIAIGIGVTMTSLSVYHMMSMDPMPHKSDKIYAPQINTRDVGTNWWTSDGLSTQMSYKDALYLYQAEIPKLKTPSFRTGYSVHLNNDRIKPFIESTRIVGQSFFEIFDIEFVEGQVWSQEQEDKAELISVISLDLSKKLFGDESAIGKQIYLDDRAFRVVGVIDGFNHHIKYYDLTNGAFNDFEEIFIPFSLTAPLEINTWGNTNGWKFEDIRGFEDKLRADQVWIQFWAQFESEAEVQEYHDFLQAYLEEQEASGRFERENQEYATRNLKEWLDYNGVVTEDNQVLVALSFMFLSVCLANILGLMLGKFLKRVPEVGVRRALGASKRDVFFQHVVEVSLLGFLGGLFGIVLAQIGLWGVRTTYQYYSDLANMDFSMFIAAPLIAIISCVIAGLYPAYKVCKTNPAICLKTQ